MQLEDSGRRLPGGDERRERGVAHFARDAPRDLVHAVDFVSPVERMGAYEYPFLRVFPNITAVV